MRTRIFAAAGALALAGAALIAAPAQAGTVPPNCTYHVAVKHNGQHLLTVTTTLASEASWKAKIVWIPETPPPIPGFAAWITTRRLVGQTVSVNLERAGIYPPGIWSITLRPAPGPVYDVCARV